MWSGLSGEAAPTDCNKQPDWSGRDRIPWRDEQLQSSSSWLASYEGVSITLAPFCHGAHIMALTLQGITEVIADRL